MGAAQGRGSSAGVRQQRRTKGAALGIGSSAGRPGGAARAAEGAAQAGGRGGGEREVQRPQGAAQGIGSSAGLRVQRGPRRERSADIYAMKYAREKNILLEFITLKDKDLSLIHI